MKVVALISGGKDSCFNMMQCVAEGHDLVALANLYPEQVDEVDSYMFQTVGHHAVDLYSQAMGLPLYRAAITGGSVEQGRDYQPTRGDEVEDLLQLLKRVKDELQVDAVSVGAILSNYQRVRVENVCSRLGLTPLAYLWRQDQTELLEEMIEANVDAIVIKVAALGLNSRHLRKTLREIQPHMEVMKSKYQLNVCGEGGEYETFTLDCPLFSKRIVIDSFDVVQHDEDEISPVFYIHFGSMHLADKDKELAGKSFSERIQDVKMRRSKNLHRELQIPNFSSTIVPETCDHHLNIICSTTEGPRSRLAPSCQQGSQGFVWVSGVRALCNAENSTSSILLSTEVAMETLIEQLKSHGFSLQDAVLVHLYVRNMADFEHINSVFSKYFALNPPARVCVQAGLPEGTALQLDCLAHRTPPGSSDGVGGGDGGRDPAHFRTTMHVQGLSHWAPANIGPYSQAVQIGSLVFCAGVIGLCPSSLRVIEGGVNAQCRLSLRSVSRVLAAMHRGLRLRDIVSATCYITDAGLEPAAKNHWERFMEEEPAEDVDPMGRETPGIPPLVNYVVVPRLPKGSLVEWHVVAATDKQEWQYSRTETSESGVSVQTESAWCEQSGAAAIMARVDPSASMKETALRVVARTLVSSLVAEVSRHGATMTNVLSFRVFHSEHQVPQAALRPALNVELAGADGGGVQFTCIPVSCLPPPSILSTCIWLQCSPTPLEDDGMKW